MGKVKIASIVLGLVIGAGAYVVGGKDVSTAVSIAFDKDAAALYCTDLLKEQAK